MGLRMLPGAPSVALLVACALAAVPVAAQQRPAHFLEQNFLTGGAERTTGVPAARPYFLGWSARVTPPESGVHQTPELGGAEADPRNGWVFVGNREGTVTALEGGEVRWQTDVGGAILASPKLYRESLVVATAEGVVHVLNKVTGERRSRAILGEELVTQPVVVDEPGQPLRAYVASSAESVFAIDLELGSKIWRAHRDAPSGFSIRGFSRPLVAHGAVFVGFADGHVESLDPADGSVKWEKRVSPPGEHLDIDALTANDASVFVASYSGGVYALDPTSGATQWRTALPGASRLRIDGAALLVGSPGLVTSLRAGDGKASWRFHLGTPYIVSTPVVVAGQVVVAELEGPIYFIDRITGQGTGMFDSGAGFSGVPGVAGNIVFALSNGGVLYSLVVVP